MLPEKLHDVLSYEGVVSLTTWTPEGPHVNNTWNTYIVEKDDDRLLIPAAGMNSTETDLDINNRIILTVGAREVEGFNGYQGTGFRITGTAKLIDEGEDYEMMKKQFSFLRKVLEIKVEEAKQLL